LLPKNGLDLTHRAGLSALLATAASKPNVADAKEILRLAAIGLLDDKATLHNPHFAIRHLGNLALARFTSTECVYLLMQVAAGDFSSWSRRPRDTAGFRAAAIFALGGIGRPVVRPTLQRQLRSEDRVVRLATAEALRRITHPQALEDLANAMRTESDPIVAQALVQSVHAILVRREKEIDMRRRQAVVQSALALLGRTDWRADLEIVELFAQLRSAAVIPAMIGILQRDAEATTSAAKPSRRLVRAALETLRSLTGAILPNDATKWREYWDRVQDEFVVAAPKKLEAARTTAGFFGLPVVGSNVVFIIDTSGSMNASFYKKGDFEPENDEDVYTRLSVAKRELLQAVDGLPADARFNVVAFSSNVILWKKTLVRATRASKAALVDPVQKVAATGATNIFGALEAALDIKTLTYGSRYGTAVDEIFLLSDGEPTVGRVKDPVTILQLIQETNRYSKVRINTIYMGGGGDSAFMKQLAAQNGGRYVRL
jgi:hypothetical protein